MPRRAAPRRSRPASAVMPPRVVAERTALEGDVLLELAPEFADERMNRQRRRVAERADGIAKPDGWVRCDRGGDVQEDADVVGRAAPLLDSAEDPRLPRRSFATWRALAAGLLRVEARDSPQAPNQARRVVHDDHAARAGHVVALLERLELQRHVHLVR